MKTTFDIYQIVTDQIISALEKGIVPWKRTWDASTGSPRSIHGRPYSGMNQLLLAVSCAANSWKHPIFITMNEANKLGGMVRKGEKSTMVVFWKTSVPSEYKDNPSACPRNELRWMLRYYRVFNIHQIENLPLSCYPSSEDAKARTTDPIPACEDIVANMPGRPEIIHRGSQPCYVPAKDIVIMPEMADFHAPESYYATLFHELVHSTGHASRLNREDAFAGKFGSEPYAKEELVAELGASFLAAKAGIAPCTIENATAYIGGWLKKLKEDKRFIVSASARAQKAAEFISRTIHREEEEND